MNATLIRDKYFMNETASRQFEPSFHNRFAVHDIFFRKLVIYSEIFLQRTVIFTFIFIKTVQC